MDMQAGQKPEENVAGHISHENDLGAEYDEEAESLPEKPRSSDQNIDEEKLRREIAEIDHYIEIARAITVETKAVKLLQALETGFKRMQELGALDKAIIFTESNRTQRYIKEYLEKTPEYKGKIATSNGQNNDDLARSIISNGSQKMRIPAGSPPRAMSICAKRLSIISKTTPV